MDALLRLESIFGTDLPIEPRFRAAVEAALTELLATGASATVARSGSLGKAGRRSADYHEPDYT